LADLWSIVEKLPLLDCPLFRPKLLLILVLVLVLLFLLLLLRRNRKCLHEEAPASYNQCFLDTGNRLASELDRDPTGTRVRTHPEVGRRMKTQILFLLRIQI